MKKVPSQPTQPAQTESVSAFAKRRGFVFPSSEIYGGFASTYDYGPLGAQMLKNIRDSWWSWFVESRIDVVGLDGAVFCHPKTWEASGHVASFADPLVEDKVTHQRYRADHLIEEALDIKTATLSFEELQTAIDKHQLKSPDGNPLTRLKSFNLLVEARLGSTDQTKASAYLRGETCQNIFLQYLNVLKSQSKQIPFGIGQIGKAFRNEVTTKDFIYRTREFQLMELEYFVNPSEGEKWYEFWREQMLAWVVNELGLPEKKFRFRPIPDQEKSHYAKKQVDFEFQSSSGKWFEISPLNHRGDWDLSRHQQYSGQNMIYLDPHTGEKFMPNVIEISFGLDRLLYTLLDNALTREEDRVVLKLSPKMAPYQVAVFPLVKNKPELVTKAEAVRNLLLQSHVRATWDQRGNIGKRYLSQDEIGTPVCVTIDYQTLEDQTATVRDRDTKKQKRVAIDQLVAYFQKMINLN
ncbi:glycine--tRNA ligase [Patescibacteria group bacterium]|nr:glycine--tRNA ligase [Patescibacteria group bacterium]